MNLVKLLFVFDIARSHDVTHHQLTDRLTDELNLWRREFKDQRRSGNATCAQIPRNSFLGY